MAAARNLPKVASRALYQSRYLPLGSLTAISKPEHQRRFIGSSQGTTAPTMSSTNGTTVMDAIKHDHDELKEYYNNILSAKDDDSKIRWQNQFVWELARHSIGEELVVYPAMEKHMGSEGKQIADKDRTEHNRVGDAHNSTSALYI